MAQQPLGYFTSAVRIVLHISAAVDILGLCNPLPVGKDINPEEVTITSRPQFGPPSFRIRKQRHQVINRSRCMKKGGAV